MNLTFMFYTSGLSRAQNKTHVAVAMAKSCSEAESTLPARILGLGAYLPSLVGQSHHDSNRVLRKRAR